MKKLGSTSGFSLIELLIVTSVAVILMMAAAPSFTQLLDSQQIDSAANRFSQLFKQARMEAIRRNQTIYIHNLNMKSANKVNWCVLVTNSATKPASCDVSNVILSFHGEGYPRVEVRNSKEDVNVDPARAIIGSGMTYKLKDADMGENDAVEVRVSGKSRVRICTVGSASGYGKC